jgi:hypothetical protein
MPRDWRLEAFRLLSENCEQHLSDAQIRSGGRRPRAGCIKCLTDELKRVYRAGAADARAGLDEALNSGDGTYKP